MDGLLNVAKWKGWLQTILMHLIDDLYCFKFRRVSDLVSDEHIMARFNDDSFHQAINNIWAVEHRKFLLEGCWLNTCCCTRERAEDHGGLSCCLIHI